MQEKPDVYANAEEIANWTYSGLMLYYKDCDLSPAVSNQFKVHQILRNGYFLDCSAYGGGMHFNTRFLIASSKAASLYEVNPNNAIYGHCCVNANSFFKVLDISEIDGKKQIFVLHIPAGGVAYFQQTISNLDEKIIERAKTGFSEKMQLEPVRALLDKFWVDRTNFPLGMDANEHFYPVYSLTPVPEKGKALYSGIRNLIPDNSDLNDPYKYFQEEKFRKPGFFGRLFGKD